MNCSICGVNEATIHLTEIINNQMIEIHLCEACAQEKGTGFKTHFNLSDLLMGLTEAEKEAKTGEKKTQIRCLECGMTYEEFSKTGRLGCAGCYESFTKLLTPLIKRVQRSLTHLGKKPANLSLDVRSRHDLRLLQDRLRKSIQMEQFEEAARLRDEIKQFEEKEKKERKSQNE
jgi:protein arginine kinase activator